MSRRPTTAVLATHWESSSEEGWTARQVAGALAGASDVHVITPDGASASTSTDGVFTLHRMGTPAGATAEHRRDLLIEAIAQTSDGEVPPVSAAVASLLDHGLLDPWRDAAELLDGLAPDRALVVGHQSVGAVAAVDRHDGSLPVTLLALGSDPQSLAFPHFDQVFDRADSVLAVTETERTAIIARHGRPDAVRRIGAPMAANPSALTEPNTWVGESEYVLVLTGVEEEADHEENELARLLQMRFPNHTVGIAHSDAFCAWRRGQVSRGWPIERTSDLDRLMAWARVTVDLHPGSFFARRCVTSLLYGTPIVVAAGSRAREHAWRGRGGLWFEGPAELAWCVETMLDPPTRAAFSTHGLAYAEEEYGSTDRFIDRVVHACGLGTAAETASLAT
jgi:hypothetical protein